MPSAMESSPALRKKAPKKSPGVNGVALKNSPSPQVTKIPKGSPIPVPVPVSALHASKDASPDPKSRPEFTSSARGPTPKDNSPRNLPVPPQYASPQQGEDYPGAPPRRRSQTHNQISDNDLERKNQSLQSQVENLRNVLKDTRNELAQSKSRVDSVQKSIKIMEKNSEHVEKELKVRNIEFHDQQSRLQIVEAENENMKATLDANEAQMRIAKLEDLLAKERRNNEKLTANLTSVEAKLTAEMQEQEANFSVKRREFEESRQKLQRQYEEAKRVHAELETKKGNKLQTQQEELLQFQEEQLHQLELDRTTREAELKELIADLEGELEKERTYKNSRVQELEKELAQSRAKEAEAEKKALKSAQKEKECRQKSEDLKHKLGDLTEENEERCLELQAREQAFEDDKAALLSDIRELQAQVEDMKRQRQAAEAGKSEKEEEIDELMKRLEEKEEESMLRMRECEERERRARHEVEQAHEREEETRRRIEEECEKLREEMGKSGDDLSKYQETARSQEQKITNLEKQLDELTVDGQTREGKQLELEEKISETAESLKNAIKAGLEKEALYDQTQEHLIEKEKQIQELNAWVNEKKEKYRALKAHKQELVEDLEVAKRWKEEHLKKSGADREKLANELKSAEKKIEESEKARIAKEKEGHANVEALRKEKDAIISELQARVASADEKEGEIMKTMRQREAADEEKQAEISEYEQLLKDNEDIVLELKKEIQELDTKAEAAEKRVRELEYLQSDERLDIEREEIERTEALSKVLSMWQKDFSDYNKWKEALEPLESDLEDMLSDLDEKLAILEIVDDEEERIELQTSMVSKYSPRVGQKCSSLSTLIEGTIKESRLLHLYIRKSQDARDSERLQLDDLSRITEEKDTLQKRYDDLHNMKLHADKELNIVLDMRDQLEAAFKEHKVETENTLLRLEDEKNDLEGTAEKLERHSMRLEREKADAEEKLESLRLELRRLTEKAEEKSKEDMMAKLQKELLEAKEESRALQALIQTFEKEGNHHQQVSDILNVDLKKTEDSLTETRSYVEHYRGKVATLRQEKVKDQEEISHIGTDLAESLEREKRLKDECQLQKQEIEESMTRLRKETQYSEDLRNSLQRALDEKMELESKLGRAKKFYDEHRDQLGLMPSPSSSTSQLSKGRHNTQLSSDEGTSTTSSFGRRVASPTQNLASSPSNDGFLPKGGSAHTQSQPHKSKSNMCKSRQQTPMRRRPQSSPSTEEPPECHQQ